MAFHFFYFLLSSIFFLPSIHCSCWGFCGRINISHPFSLSSSTSPTSPPPYYGPKPMTPIQHVEACDGILRISCVEGPDHNPVANIEIGERQYEYVVMDINYTDTVVTVVPVQDPTVQANFNSVPCGFFLKFASPLHHYTGLLNYLQFQDFNNRLPGCELGSRMSQSLSTDCPDYSLYYWNEADQHDVADICKSNGATVNMTLSFSDGYYLSLLSVGFSQHVHLSEDCFNSCQVDGKRCTSSKGQKSSTLSCEPICKNNEQMGDGGASNTTHQQSLCNQCHRPSTVMKPLQSQYK